MAGGPLGCAVRSEERLLATLQLRKEAQCVSLAWISLADGEGRLEVELSPAPAAGSRTEGEGGVFWTGSFTHRFLKELTERTGHPLSAADVWALLKNALENAQRGEASSESRGGAPFLNVLTSSDLAALKQKAAFQQKPLQQGSECALAEGDSLSSCAPEANARVFLILGRVVEGRNVYYPFALQKQRRGGESPALEKAVPAPADSRPIASKQHAYTPTPSKVRDPRGGLAEELSRHSAMQPPLDAAEEVVVAGGGFCFREGGPSPRQSALPPEASLLSLGSGSRSSISALNSEMRRSMAPTAMAASEEEDLETQRLRLALSQLQVQLRESRRQCEFYRRELCEVAAHREEDPLALQELSVQLHKTERDLFAARRQLQTERHLRAAETSRLKREIEASAKREEALRVKVRQLETRLRSQVALRNSQPLSAPRPCSAGSRSPSVRSVCSSRCSSLESRTARRRSASGEMFVGHAAPTRQQSGGGPSSSRVWNAQLQQPSPPLPRSALCRRGMSASPEVASRSCLSRQTGLKREGLAEGTTPPAERLRRLPAARRFGDSRFPLSQNAAAAPPVCRSSASFLKSTACSRARERCANASGTADFPPHAAPPRRGEDGLGAAMASGNGKGPSPYGSLPDGSRGRAGTRAVNVFAHQQRNAVQWGGGAVRRCRSSESAAGPAGLLSKEEGGALQISTRRRQLTSSLASDAAGGGRPCRCLSVASSARASQNSGSSCRVATAAQRTLSTAPRPRGHSPKAATLPSCSPSRRRPSEDLRPKDPFLELALPTLDEEAETVETLGNDAFRESRNSGCAPHHPMLFHQQPKQQPLEAAEALAGGEGGSGGGDAFILVSVADYQRLFLRRNSSPVSDAKASFSAACNAPSSGAARGPCERQEEEEAPLLLPPKAPTSSSLAATPASPLLSGVRNVAPQTPTLASLPLGFNAASRAQAAPAAPPSSASSPKPSVINRASFLSALRGVGGQQSALEAPQQSPLLAPGKTSRNERTLLRESSPPVAAFSEIDERLTALQRFLKATRKSFQTGEEPHVSGSGL